MSSNLTEEASITMGSLHLVPIGPAETRTYCYRDQHDLD
jgi:hypothetical protein